MSSDYYGGIAGEIADEGAAAERAFLAWLDEFARREAEGTYHDALRAAFKAGRQSLHDEQQAIDAYLTGLKRP
jgi:hypothetical protein